MNEASHIIAFLWKTCSEVFYVDEPTGRLAFTQAYAPYSLRHPLNLSGHGIPVDLCHEAPLEGASASIWHTDTHMMGLVSFADAGVAMSPCNSVTLGGLQSISPEVDHIESTFVESEGENVRLITSARVKGIALVKNSANPCARAWVQAWNTAERPFTEYDHDFEKDWNMWRTAHDQDRARVAQASINARNIRERYKTASR